MLAEYACPINSTCAVFAESEVISLLASGNHAWAQDDLIERYREATTYCHANGIIRNPVAVDDWFDRRSIQQALADLGLQNDWTAWKADGTPSA